MSAPVARLHPLGSATTQLAVAGATGGATQIAGTPHDSPVTGRELRAQLRMQQERNYGAGAYITEPDHVAPDAMHAQGAELRELVAIVAASWPEAERAEALAVALADPADALTCWRTLAEDHADATARIVYPAGPYTSASLAERDPTDDRRTCLDCANLTATEHRCLAAWRGERPGNAARNYHPAPDILKRCECYRPQPAEPDQRIGAERWPEMGADTRRIQERAKHG